MQWNSQILASISQMRFRSPIILKRINALIIFDRLEDEKQKKKEKKHLPAKIDAT